MPLFDSEFLKKLEYLSLISKRVFRGSLMAQRRTMALGTGIEFADHREYTPGDDFRYLDWNLYARHDELLLKRFQEEEDLHVYFLVDCSRSMAFGDPPKFDFARQVAAALAYIALADLDRIAVTAFARDIVADFPLTRGKGRILSLLKFLEGLEAQGEDTDLERVVSGFVHRDQRRGLAVVVSDLYDPQGFERGLDLLRHRKYEPHVVQVYDKYEKDPVDMLGDVEMWDVERGTNRKVTITERNLRQYKKLFQDFQDRVQAYGNRYGLGCTRTSTEIPFDELILKMMRQAGAVRPDGRAMNLEYPNMLLWGLLAVPVVIFYILKIRLRRIPVSTVIFWQQIFEERKPRSIWQRLRHLVSLLVQLALLALLVGALTEPYRTAEKTTARRVVLVLDNSASMNATDVAPSRLAKAKDEAGQVVRSLRNRDEMAIVAAGTQPRVVCGLTGHQKTLRDALAGVAGTDGPTQLAEAIALARRLVADAQDGRDTRVVVVTDACAADAAKLSAEPSVQFVTVGGRAANLAITRFQVRRSAIDPIGYEILVEVTNQSDDPAEECRLDVGLRDGDRSASLDIVPLKLGPNEKWTKVLENRTADGGVLAARLTKKPAPAVKPDPNKDPPGVEDALAADNVAYALLPKREMQPVHLSGTPNLFLQKVLEANPLVKLTVAKDFPADVPAGAVKVFHRAVPAKLPPGPVLVVDPANDCDLWALGDKLANPIVTQQDKDSPLMAHVRLDNVILPEARKITFTPAAGKPQVLAASVTGEPLFLTLGRPEGKVVVLTVNLDLGDLPFRTVFPILATNTLNDFAGGQGELKEALAAGATADVQLPPQTAGTSEYLLRAPDGSTRKLPAGGVTTTVGPFDACGVWAVVPNAPGAAPVEQFAVNLMNRTESDLRPPDGVAAAASATDAGLVSGFFGYPLWFYLVGLGLVLAAVEWYLYQRRWIS